MNHEIRVLSAKQRADFAALREQWGDRPMAPGQLEIWIKEITGGGFSDDKQDRVSCRDGMRETSLLR
jgi:hypothetical protein